MADILPRDLQPFPGGAVLPGTVVIIDDGAGVYKATVEQVAATGMPLATSAEVFAGSSVQKYLNPERTVEAINTHSPVRSVNGETGVVIITKGDIGLGNVENIDLSATTGASNIGTASGQSVQEALDQIAPPPGGDAPTYTSVPDGLSASSSGRDFTVDNGDGTFTVYLNDGGVAVEQRTLATTAYLAAATGSAAIGYKYPTATSVLRTLADKLAESVSVKDFGAKCDGTTDDTAAVQSCVDFCLSSSPPKAMEVPGVCKITAPIMIDRMVDTSRNEFIIYSKGDGGFYCDIANMTMFNSTIPLSANGGPRSEFMTWVNINFVGPVGVTVYSHSERFLRQKFSNCYWDRCSILNASTYAQEWLFQVCIARSFQADWFKANGCFRVSSSLGKYQNGNGTVFNLSQDSTHGANSVSLVSDTVEANTGGYVKGVLVRGFACDQVYAERNVEPLFQFDLQDALNIGVSITASNMYSDPDNAADPDFYEIRWGRIAGGNSAANFVFGNLHHIGQVLPGGLCSTSDYATQKLYSRNDVSVRALPDGAPRVASGVVAYAGGGQANATLLTGTVNRITSATVAGDSVKLPPALLTTSVPAGIEITVVNYSPHMVTVWGNQPGNLINSAASFNIESGFTYTFYCVANGVWNLARQFRKAVAVTNASGTVTDAKFNELLTSLRNAGLLTS